MHARFAVLLLMCAAGCASSAPAGPPAPAGPRSDPAAIAATAQIVYAAVPGSRTAQPPGTSRDAQQLFTSKFDGTHRIQLTSDGQTKFLPHFSPDGRQLLYTQFYRGIYGDADTITDVALYDLTTGMQRRLTHLNTGWQPVWSPDGKRIAFGSTVGDALWIMNADGSDQHIVAHRSGTADDERWGDYAWSRSDWILFTTAENSSGCFKSRLDEIRPDGTGRTKVTEGGPNCTPAGFEQSGDADPGFSPDGTIIYSSRGFPRRPTGIAGATERRLYAFSSEAWSPAKTETDLSVKPSDSCIEGVPKASPSGSRIMLFRACAGEAHAGIVVTNPRGTYRTWIADGFGADWNPRSGL